MYFSGIMVRVTITLNLNIFTKTLIKTGKSYIYIQQHHNYQQVFFDRVLNFRNLKSISSISVELCFNSNNQF